MEGGFAAGMQGSEYGKGFFGGSMRFLGENVNIFINII